MKDTSYNQVENQPQLCIMDNEPVIRRDSTVRFLFFEYELYFRTEFSSASSVVNILTVYLLDS